MRPLLTETEEHEEARLAMIVRLSSALNVDPDGVECDLEARVLSAFGAQFYWTEENQLLLIRAQRLH